MDYTATSEEVTFSSTVMRRCISVPILDDSISEDMEPFTVTFTSEDTDVTTVTSTVNVFIIDDDSVTVGIEREVYSSSEDRGFTEVCVVLLEGELNREIVLSLATSPGTAEGMITMTPFP